jgi:hypothetical protein
VVNVNDVDGSNIAFGLPDGWAIPGGSPPAASSTPAPAVKDVVEPADNAADEDESAAAGEDEDDDEDFETDTSDEGSFEDEDEDDSESALDERTLPRLGHIARALRRW